MKTNKACPKYVGDPVLEGLSLTQQEPIKVAMTEQVRTDSQGLDREGDHLTKLAN